MIHYSEFFKKPIPTKQIEIARKSNKSNAIFTFDIETTSLFVDSNNYAFTFEELEIVRDALKMTDKDFYKDYKKTSVSYIWMFSINDTVYYGRNLEEAEDFIMKVNYFYSCKMIVYVHNLAFEFQNLKNIFTFDKVFAREQRKPLYAVCENITFKCSYTLSNSKLENLSKLYGLNTKKLTGNLDYSKMRHTGTALEQKEMDYCKHDCLALYEYIKYEREQAGGKLSKIPLTSTGKVRNLVKAKYKEAQGSFGYSNLKKRVARLTPDLETFEDLVKAFAGGYTHANADRSEKVWYNVRSRDFKSEYPSVMVMERYPAYPFKEIAISYDDILKNSEHTAYLVTVKYTNIESIGSNHYISRSKCKDIKFGLYDNGRVDSAEELTLTCTEQDLLIIDENYIFDDPEIIRARFSQKRYLEEIFVECINELFTQKQDVGVKLKTDPSLKAKYSLVKSLINSIYGMSVTNYISDIVGFDGINGKWTELKIGPKEIREELKKLQEEETLAMPYQTGVWVTAYARRNLWKLIAAIDDDVIYCDTDSIKYLNWEKYEYLFEDYNKKIKAKLDFVRKDRKMDLAGLEDIGIAELDSYSINEDTGEESDLYFEFITLGAKKYAYRDVNGLHITVSGVSKKGVIALKNDINNFNENLFFSTKESFKNSIYYCDEEMKDLVIVDYRGDEMTMDSLSGACIKPATYQMSISKDYREYLQLIRGGCEYLKNI